MADEFDISGLGKALGVKTAGKNEIERHVVATDAEAEALAKKLAAEKRKFTVSVQPSQGDFNLEGLRGALGVNPAAVTAAPVAETTAAPAAVTAAAPARAQFAPVSSFVAPSPSNQAIASTIESIPGVREIGAAGLAAGATISKGMSGIQQLVGRYFPGLSEERRNAIAQNAAQNIAKAEAAVKPAEEQYPVATTIGEVGGFLANPANKLVPGFGPATGVIGAGTKAAAQGAIANPLTTPATSETVPFETEKLNQALTGAAGGALLGPALHVAANSLGRGVDAVRQRFGNMIPNERLQDNAIQVIQSAGIDPSKVSPAFFNGLVDQAKNALKTGDVQGFKNFAVRYSEASNLPVSVPMLRGQVTRDPMQYAVEQNLRGLQGVGEPIQEVMTKANSALLQNFDALGAKKGQDIIESGGFLRSALTQIDEVEAQKVRDAYAAYKNSTGKEIPVPLQGLAQEYARVVKDFGRSNIPEGVRNNMESLGLLRGKQSKLVTIDDAEELIKNINLNKDPSKQTLSTLNALNNLHRSVNEAIWSAGANLPGQAGAAAREARAIASARFKTIEGIPALKDVLNGKEPDKFVRQHILQGNVDEISRMQKYLQEHNPKALQQLQYDVISHIKQKVMGNKGEDNALFKNETMRDFVGDKTESLARLKRFLSPEQLSTLRQMNRVAENIYVEPIASAINRSNTAVQAANLVQSVVNSGAINDIASMIATAKLPYIAPLGQRLLGANQSARGAELVKQAIEPTARPRTEIKTFIKPGVAGAGAITAATRQSNIQNEQQNQ
ncbi:hypothetical protein UFOVP953_4 [uncultured Caudovirales phage]|uniref:Uncharacterized protein n=1 Tax=uncultured Caudovirales phage TaxID=2100421 RepID=A0A6J5PZM6_9CAUD|nr:hypothetical protein UFOVP953_4 [uncultured Caudovirales phage]